jgi:hypothetical protein
VRYGLLLLPSANRVYAGSAPTLACAELSIFNQFALDGRLEGIAAARLSGVPYVVFDSGERPLAAAEITSLSHLSAAYALFERGDGPALVPVELTPTDHWDDDLVTIQRYAGKTNEQFTKLLVNIAVIVTHGRAAFTGAKLTVLDPLCGRGTTLNQAVIYGFDAVGIERDARDVDSWAVFFETWLKDKRAKHHMERTRLRRDGRVSGAKVTVEFAPGKTGDRQRVIAVADDTLRAQDHLRPGSVDAIVTDLPYGVQHGSHSSAGLSRRPGELVHAALPVWSQLLRPGGAMVLAFNLKTLPADGLAAAVQAAGLDVVETPPLVHVVDRAIERDVIVARRPLSQHH